MQTRSKMLTAALGLVMLLVAACTPTNYQMEKSSLQKLTNLKASSCSMLGKADNGNSESFKVSCKTSKGSYTISGTYYAFAQGGYGYTGKAVVSKGSRRLGTCYFSGPYKNKQMIVCAKA